MIPYINYYSKTVLKVFYTLYKANTTTKVLTSLMWAAYLLNLKLANINFAVAKSAEDGLEFLI